VDRKPTAGLMWPSHPSTLSSARGRRLSMSDLSVRVCIRGLRALLDRLESRGSSSGVVSRSSEENCLLPLSRSQSQLLADLVTTLVQHSTWWSTEEEKDSWAMCGEVGGASGPHVTVFISAMSDRDVGPPI